MKKTLAFILFIILLFLVSCGETQPTLYGISGKNLFYELPSRIVFTDDSGAGIQNYYYSKADGTVYPFCFDPLCGHKISSDCMSVQADLFAEGPVYIGNRFYYRSIDKNELRIIETCYSCAFDGTDIREEFTVYGGMRSGTSGGYQPPVLGIVPTDRYIYVFTIQPDGTRGILRYDTQARELLDLSDGVSGISPNGLYMAPSTLFVFGDKCFFGTVEQDIPFHGFVSDVLPTVYETHYYEANLDFSEKKESELAEKLLTGGYSYGDFFGDTVCISNSTKSGDPVTIKTLNASSGEETVLPASEIGFRDVFVFYFDGEYCYFQSYDNRICIGKGSSRKDVYNSYGGKIYRVKPDGSDLMLVCDQPNFLTEGSMIIWENKALVLGNIYVTKDDGTVGLGNKDKYGNLEFCLFEATIQEDGTWSPLTRVPYVFEE